MNSILNKGFKYVPSYSTDLKKRFKNMERERRAAEARNTLANSLHENVAMLPTRAKK